MASTADHHPTTPGPTPTAASTPTAAAASTPSSARASAPAPAPDAAPAASAEPAADPQTVRIADRLLRDVLRHTAGRSLALGLVSTLAAGAGLALPAAVGHTVDLLLADGAGDGGAATGRWVVGCVALTGLLIVLDALSGLLTGATNACATAWVRRHTLRHALAVGERRDGLAHGDLVSRLVGNAVHTGTAPTTLAATLAAVLTPLGGLVALVLIDPWLALAFLVGLPVLGVLLRTFVRDTSDSVARYQQGQGEIAGRLVETLHGARTVAAAGTAARERARILAGLPELGRHGHRMWRVQGRASAQAAAVLPLLQILVLAVAGVRLAAGGLSVGSLLAASRYAALATGIGMVVGRINALVRSRAAARRLAQVLAPAPPDYGTRTLTRTDDASRAPAGDGAEPDRPGTLELRGVGVARGGRQVLRGVTLCVPGGRTVAVVGRSGSGKSLLAAVAGRLTDPDEGQVLLDGVPLPELRHAALRHAIGYAFQRPALLGGTVGGTIAFGPAAPSPDEVAAAARAARADDFIRLLPDGYATPCAGAPLSGGEVQRLGLARAFAHPGRLLILDDATSSLDMVTERQVSAALWEQRNRRTCLIVAHRASTAARADLVAWLADGALRALAPHHELWQHPDYRAVFDASPGQDLASAGAGARTDTRPEGAADG